MIRLFWNQIKLILNFIFRHSKQFETINSTVEKRLIFNNLSSFLIGKFNEDTADMSLDESLRRKLNFLVKVLKIQCHQRILEIDAEWGFISCSLASSIGIMPTCIFSDCIKFHFVCSLMDVFPTYCNMNVCSTICMQKVMYDNYYDVVFISNTFIESCSYLTLNLFLKDICKATKLNGKVHLEFYSSCKYFNELDDFSSVILQCNWQKAVSPFFSLKYIIHAISQSGFELMTMTNISSDARKTLQCYVQNIEHCQEHKLDTNAVPIEEIDKLKLQFQQKFMLLSQDC